MVTKTFTEISTLVRKYRTQKGLSQSELSHKLGYKNGQFISNVERGLCGIPFKKTAELSILLDIPKEELEVATTADFKNHFNNEFTGRINELKDGKHLHHNF